MKNSSKQKLELRQLLHSCFCLGMALAFTLNSFLPAYTFSKNYNLQSDKLKYSDLSHISYAYKTVLNKDVQENNEIIDVSNELISNSKEINPQTVEELLEEKVNNSPVLKAELIEKAYEKRFKKDLPKGTALTLASALTDKNSYSTIYEALNSQFSI